MTLCAGALRGWLDERDELPETPLLAMVPVSVRTDDERGSFGNRISTMIVPLPTDEPDPVVRLQRVHEAMRAAKERHRATPATLLQDANHFIPPALFARAARVTSRVAVSERLRAPLNLVISNVPGSPAPLYCAGAETLDDAWDLIERLRASSSYQLTCWMMPSDPAPTGSGPLATRCALPGPSRFPTSSRAKAHRALAAVVESVRFRRHARGVVEGRDRTARRADGAGGRPQSQVRPISGAADRLYDRESLDPSLSPARARTLLDSCADLIESIDADPGMTARLATTTYEQAASALTETTSGVSVTQVLESVSLLGRIELLAETAVENRVTARRKSFLWDEDCGCHESHDQAGIKWRWRAWRVRGWRGRGALRRRLSVLLAVGAAGAVATGLTAWAVARSPILVDPKAVSIWRALVVASYVAVGLYRWWRRPDGRYGPLLVGNGLLYAATSFNASGASAAYTLGMVFWAVYVVYTAYLLLSYPGGRLESRLERGFIRAYALSTAVLWGLILALSPTFPGAGSFNDCGTRCPPNALAIDDAGDRDGAEHGGRASCSRSR